MFHVHGFSKNFFNDLINKYNHANSGLKIKEI